jgi:hypothetical protein
MPFSLIPAEAKIIIAAIADAVIAVKVNILMICYFFCVIVIQ